MLGLGIRRRAFNVVATETVHLFHKSTDRLDFVFARTFIFQGDPMRKITSFTYDVSPGEQISINVTPTNFAGSAPDVEAVLDGVDLLNTGSNDAPVYAFTVTKPINSTHRVLIEFIFFPDAPPTSFYQVDITGENDDGCPCGFIIAKSNPIHEAGIRFRVRA
jgi:hypothetical protein